MRPSTLLTAAESEEVVVEFSGYARYLSQWNTIMQEETGKSAIGYGTRGDRQTSQFQLPYKAWKKIHGCYWNKSRLENPEGSTWNDVIFFCFPHFPDQVWRPFGDRALIANAAYTVPPFSTGKVSHRTFTWWSWHPAQLKHAQGLVWSETVWTAKTQAEAEVMIPDLSANSYHKLIMAGDCPPEEILDLPPRDPKQWHQYKAQLVANQAQSSGT